MDAVGGLGWPDDRFLFPRVCARWIPITFRCVFGRAAESTELPRCCDRRPNVPTRSRVRGGWPVTWGEVLPGAGRFAADDGRRTGVVDAAGDACPAAGTRSGRWPGRSLPAAAASRACRGTCRRVRSRLEGRRDGRVGRRVAARRPRAGHGQSAADRGRPVRGTAHPGPSDSTGWFAALSLPDAIPGPVKVVATLRPEFLDNVAGQPGTRGLPPRSFTLRPLRPGCAARSHPGPGRAGRDPVDPELVVRLVADTGTGEALPLLAFTLEQLAADVPRGAVTLSTARMSCSAGSGGV